MKKFRPASFDLPIFSRFQVGVLRGKDELQKMKNANPQLRASLDKADKFHACAVPCVGMSIMYFSDACLKGKATDLATFRRKNNSLRHGDFSSRAVPFLHDRT
jgi:hypothetical protein